MAERKIRERKTKLDRARGYPYAIPDESYTWRGGDIAPFEPESRGNRTPVLAIGSNQSPEQLSRKFGEAGEIPVQRARLADFDIYYSAHISSYGSVPAMLQHAPGTNVTLSINWLDAHQLDVMHDTELSAAKYDYAAIEGIDLALDCGTKLDFAHVYVGVSGNLMHQGGALALAAVSAENRRPKALSTAEVLEIVRQRLSPDDDPDEFVLRLVDDSTYREACSGLLAVDAVAFGHPHRRLMPGYK